MNQKIVLTGHAHEISQFAIVALLESRGLVVHVVNLEDWFGYEKKPTLRPDLGLFSLEMPVLNGITVAQQIRRFVPHMRVVLLSRYFSEALVRKSLNVGVSGLWDEADRFDNLGKALDAALDGRTFFSDNLLSWVTAAADNIERKEVLTLHERIVLQLLAEGFSSLEIASALNVATATVRKHRSNIFRKLQMQSPQPLDVVRYALKNGLMFLNMIEPRIIAADSLIR